MIRFNFSHDLRSPSSSLLGLARVLRDPSRALTPGEIALRIETLAAKTLALADGFIALAIAQVIESTRFEPLNLRDVLQDAIDEVWASAAAKHVTIINHKTSADCEAHGNRQMLTRALINLLNNAIKFSPANTTVTVNIESVATNWSISVQDQGPGIPLDRQGLLFQRFKRAVHHGETVSGRRGVRISVRACGCPKAWWLDQRTLRCQQGRYLQFHYSDLYMLVV